MHTRPYTVRFALCIAGIILGGAILFDSLDRAFDPYFLTFWGGVGLTVFLSIVADGIHQHHAELIRAEANRLYAQELTNWEREQALERAHAPETDDDHPSQSDHRATAVGVHRFFRAGDALGFAFDDLHDAGVLTYHTWMRLKEFYLIWPENGPVLVDRGGSAGTEWSPTWTLGKIGDTLAMGELPLPPGAPPQVSAHFTAKQNTKQPKKTQKRVVEGVAKPAE